MSVSTIAHLSIVVLMLALATNAITVEDVYKRLPRTSIKVLMRGTFGIFNGFSRLSRSFQIWPRTYGRPSALFFDENGASYNVRPERPSLTHILRRTPLGGRYLNAVGEVY
ncbi:hypothetical protein AAVH_13053 [Aphelenchoides avenae]|nr:hypothetical protein AAVH_13053 [Aphelenchus avenae]